MSVDIEGVDSTTSSKSGLDEFRMVAKIGAGFAEHGLDAGDRE